MKRPYITAIFNGNVFSHYELRDAGTGQVLWSEKPVIKTNFCLECKINLGIPYVSGYCSDECVKKAIEREKINKNEEARSNYFGHQCDE